MPDNNFPLKECQWIPCSSLKRKLAKDDHLLISVEANLVDRFESEVLKRVWSDNLMEVFKEKDGEIYRYKIVCLNASGYYQLGHHRSEMYLNQK